MRVRVAVAWRRRCDRHCAAVPCQFFPAASRRNQQLRRDQNDAQFGSGSRRQAPSHVLPAFAAGSRFARSRLKRSTAHASPATPAAATAGRAGALHDALELSTLFLQPPGCRGRRQAAGRDQGRPLTPLERAVGPELRCTGRRAGAGRPRRSLAATAARSAALPLLPAAAPAITSPNNPHFRTLRPAAGDAPLGMKPCDYCKASRRLTCAATAAAVQDSTASCFALTPHCFLLAGTHQPNHHSPTAGAGGDCGRVPG